VEKLIGAGSRVAWGRNRRSRPRRRFSYRAHRAVEVCRRSTPWETESGRLRGGVSLVGCPLHVGGEGGATWLSLLSLGSGSAAGPSPAPRWPSDRQTTPKPPSPFPPFLHTPRRSSATTPKKPSSDPLSFARWRRRAVQVPHRPRALSQTRPNLNATWACEIAVRGRRPPPTE
jgi:hypothetical protein